MDLRVAHEFDTDVDHVAAALLDLDFQASLKKVGHLHDREVLSQAEEDGLLVRRTRCILDIDVNGVAKRFIGDAEPAWVEVATWHPDELTWRWHIEPEVAADLLHAHGETRLEPTGDGAVRIVDATVKVRVPLYGGKVESWIADGLESSYDEEAEILARWLSSNG